MIRSMLAFAIVLLTPPDGLSASCPTGADMQTGIVLRTEDGTSVSTVRRLDDATTEEKRVTVKNGIETRLTRVALGGLVRVNDMQNGIVQTMEYPPGSSLPPMPLQTGVYRFEGHLTNEQQNLFKFLIDVRDETETIRIGECEYPTTVVRYAELLLTPDANNKTIVTPVFAKVYHSTDLGYPLRVGIFKTMELDHLIGVDAYKSIEASSASRPKPSE